jgi:diketogulonate reductase-like aldo/keto reductase
MANDINISTHINNMPLVGLGTFRSDDKALLKQAVKHAIKVGYRHIDCGKRIVRIF